MTVIAPRTLNKSILSPITNVDPTLSEKPSLLDVTSAALATSNTIGSVVSKYSAGVLTPEGNGTDYYYDVFEKIKGTAYEPFIDEFDNVHSERDRLIVQKRIDNRIKDRKTLEKAGTFGTAMNIGMAIADPVTLYGFGLGIKAANTMLPAIKTLTKVGAGTKAEMITEGITTGAVGTLGASAIGESIFANTNELETNEDALQNVALDTIIGGILGGSLAGVTHAMKNRAAKALVVDKTPQQVTKDIQAQQEALEIADNLNTSLSLSAAVVPKRTLTDLTLKGKTAQWFAKKFKRLNPTFNMAQSESLTVREIGLKLMTSDFIFDGNAAFQATPHAVETALVKYDALQGYGLKEIERSFENYSGRIRNEAGKTGIVPLTKEEFRKAVGTALINAEQHVIPEVEAVANYYRKNVYDAVFDQAVEVGLFKGLKETAKDTVKKAAKGAKKVTQRVTSHIPKNALSYFPTLYDKAAIQTDLQGFKEVLIRNLKKVRVVDATRAEKLRLKYTELQDKLASATKKADKEKYTKSLARLENTLENYRLTEDLSEGDFIDMANEIIDGIMGLPDGLAFRTRIPLSKGPTKHRTLDFIPQNELIPWTKTDVADVTATYLKAITPEIEITRAFGSVDLKEPIRRVREEYSQLISKAKDPKQVKKLTLQRDNDLKDIDALVGRLRGTYGRPLDADSVLNNGLHALRLLNVVTKLGSTSLSMATDFGRLVAIRGFKQTFSEALIPMIKRMDGFKMSVEEGKQAGALWNIVLGNSRAMNLAELTDRTATTSRVKQGLQALTDHYSRINLTNFFENVKRQMSAVLIQNEVLENVGKAIKKTIGQDEIEMLASSGIDEEMAGRIARMFESHGQTEDGLKIANTAKWTDKEARGAYQNALNRQIMLFNTNPTIGNRPRFMSTTMGKTLLQFESFSLAATSKIMVASMQQQNARTLASIVSMVGIGMMMYHAKQYAMGKVPSGDLRVWITEGFNNSGIFGILSSVNDRLSRVSNGTIRAGSLIGAPGFSSPKGVDPYKSLADLLGPTGQTAIDILRLGKLVDEKSRWNNSDTHAIRRSLIPTQNLIGFRMLWDEAEEAFNEAIGVE